jgi:2-iminobutanoate/2-iminopropanoate deaminase
VSFQLKQTHDAPGRISVYVESYPHSNPIPAACRIDNLVYSSIIHGIDRSREDRSATLEEQAQLMFVRLREIVEAAGGAVEDVVKVTMWMRNRADREAVNRPWLDTFPDPASRPARQTINAHLDDEQLIQCDFVAVIQNDRGDHRS